MRREISVNHVVGFLGWRAFGFCRRWIYSSPGTLVTSLDVPVPIMTSCSDSSASSASRSRCFPLEVAFPAPSDVTSPSIFFLYSSSPIPILNGRDENLPLKDRPSSRCARSFSPGVVSPGVVLSMLSPCSTESSSSSAYAQSGSSETDREI